MQYVYVLTIRKRHSSTYLHQGPYETTFKFTRSGFFYYDMQQIAHTHKYQSPKHAWFVFIKIYKIHKLFSEKSKKKRWKIEMRALEVHFTNISVSTHFRWNYCTNVNIDTLSGSVWKLIPSCLKWERYNPSTV